MKSLKIDILTLFPGMFAGPLDESMIGRARQKGLLKVGIHDLREFSANRHRKVDDSPFGGGPGMVIQAEPIWKALKKIAGRTGHVIYLSPQGTPLTHAVAERLSKKKHLVLLCGHYEGIDERAMRWVDEEISIGDFVLTGGELPAMVLAEAAARLIPGVVKDPESLQNDSFAKGMLDYPHYTRPADFKGMKVPEVLLSGDHKKIKAWRDQESRNNTARKRPDLLKNRST